MPVLPCCRPILSQALTRGVQLRRTLTSKIDLSYLRLSVLQKIMPDSTHPNTGEPLIRAIAMPADANPSGDIFGGWLMSQMDLAAAHGARRRGRGRLADVGGGRV